MVLARKSTNQSCTQGPDIYYFCLPLISASVKIAITQPNFFPWLGYFDLLDAVDCWVSLDNVQIVKRSFIVRNRILDSNGEPKWISASLQKHSQKSNINEVFLAEGNWWQTHLNKLRSYYRQAPYFDEYMPLISEIMAPKIEDVSLAAYNLRTVKAISDLLGISVETKIASEIIPVLQGSAEEKLLSLCEVLRPTDLFNFKKGVDIGLYQASNLSAFGINLHRQDYIHPEYDQANDPFVAYLSIIDLLLNKGPQAIEVIRMGSQWTLMPE